MRVNSGLSSSKAYGLVAAVLLGGLAIAASPLQEIRPIDRDLFMAAERGDVQATLALIQAGANVNVAIPGNGSPLIAAARQGHRGAVELLLNRGADPNMPVVGDGNPLIMAAREGHTPVVELLLKRGARVDAVVPLDENALIQACAEGHLEVVQLLVQWGADINARVWVRDSVPRPAGQWRSPLIMAREGKHQAVMDYLISLGARA